MADEYEHVRLGEVASVRSGFAFKSSDWTDCGVPVVKIANVKDGCLVMGSCSYVTLEVARAAAEFALEEGDILIAMTGYIGDVALVRPSDLPAVLNQRVGRFSIRDSSRLDRRFLFYLLRWPDIRSKIEGLGYGSAQPNISPSLIHNVHIPLPPFPEQQAIAHILGTLDDKIELNRRMNETLEAIARALFKSWFVDFDPVRAKAEGRQPVGMDAETAAQFPNGFEESELGEIPKGWRVGKVSDVCSTQYGYTASASEQFIGPHLLRITDMNKEPWIDWHTVPYCVISDDLLPRYRLNIGDVLVSRMADPGKAAIIEESIPAVFASYLIRLQTSHMAMSYYLFYFLRSQQYLEYAQGAMSGSVQANMNARVITAADMLIPTDKATHAFLDRVLPLRQKITANLQQSRVLMAIRDALLPKLLSGEIRVKEVENLVEAKI